MAKKRDYYKEIDDELIRLENRRYAPKGISWATNRISWCWKFRKITEEQKNNLCDRAIFLFETYGADIFD